MLAQNFLDHKALGITEEEQSALIKVLGMFEREEIPADNLVMVTWDCGTAHCIGGWADIALGKTHHFFYRTINPSKCPSALHDLFYPRDGRNLCGINWGQIGPQQAASALRNYLTLGEPLWQQVLTSDHQS